MTISQKTILHCAACGSLILWLATLPTYATPLLSAEAEIFLDGVSADQDSESGQLDTASAQAVAGGGFDEIDANSTVTAEGGIAVSAGFLGASGTSAVVNSRASWSETYTATAAAATFKFFIPGATLAVESNNVPGLKAAYDVQVLLDGGAIFSSMSELELLSGFANSEADLKLTETGQDLDALFINDLTTTPLGGGVFGEGLSGYIFDAFFGDIELQNLVVGEEFTITYQMASAVDGLVGETAAFASIGDPFSLQQDAGVSLVFGEDNNGGGSSPDPIPLPAPAYLILLGLVALRLRQ